MAPGCLFDSAHEALAELNEALLGARKTHKSEAGSSAEYPGLAASFRDDGGDVIASQALPEIGIKKLVEFVEDLAKQDFAALATLQRLAGKLSFTRTAIMGRFG